MISTDSITLTPPMLYMYGDIVNDEVKSLINSITDFFSQTNMIYLADLTVSCNEWENIKDNHGVTLGKKRKDVIFPLNKLSRLDVYDDCLKFTLNNDTVHTIKITQDFFYFFTWERDYYD